MSLSTQPYKGARDFYPEDKRLQKYMFSKIRQTVESYGYEEYDAPILEPLELYAAKSGEEIVNEQTYSFTDRGGREVVIRPEMTPTVSRMVAGRRQELGYPLRWYSIPNLWRYERPQRGRLREHWQLNVDMFGVADSAAELEIILLVNDIFQKFGATSDMYKIQLNSRALIDRILNNHLGLDSEQQHGVSKLIDRIHKLSSEAFTDQLEVILTQEQKDAGLIGRLSDILNVSSIDELPEELKSGEDFRELASLIDELTLTGLTNVVFDATLMRGFDYYTGIVFEVSDTHPDNNRSMMGGGRYDGLVGLFGVEPVPTIGFGLGDATLANFLELHELLPQIQTETHIYIALAGEINPTDVQALARRLREAGCNTAVDISGRKLGDQLRTATKKGFSECLVIGQDELVNSKYLLKNLMTGDSELFAETELIVRFLANS